MKQDMDVFFSPEYAKSLTDFDTTRKGAQIAASLNERPINHVRLVIPQPATRLQTLLAHTEHYLHALETGEPRSLARSADLGWDQGRLVMARSAVGGMIAAARSALEHGVAGTLSSGFHHARASRGRGYCTLNGLAITTRVLETEDALKRVLILDLDAHGGGGTVSILERTSSAFTHADVSVRGFDLPCTHIHERVYDARQYLETIKWVLVELEAHHEYDPFEIVLYNAGMDPHEYGGGLTGIDAATLAARERMVFDWTKQHEIPIAFTLAGGYHSPMLTKDALVDLHRLTILQAARMWGELHG